MALALARKYRPRSFAEVSVQTHVSNTLRGAIARDRVAHGYLFCGPRGTGKTTLARVLAMALNCENKRPDGEPDGTCQNCQRIWSGSSSLDVIEIDAASNRGVDDARELRERAMYAPSGDDRYKVYIVDEAHMLTREAWNALLKVLEEPPPRVVFVFATTEPQKIAQTAAPVLSRLQRFDLRRMGMSDIVARLTYILAQEQVSAHPDALAMIARAGDGSMRDALSLTDQVISLGEGNVTPEAVRDALGLVPEDEFLAILDLIADARAGDVFTTVQRLADAGIDFGTFLSGLADMLRAQLATALGSTPTDVSATAAERLVANTSRFSAGNLLRMLNALSELEPRFRKSGQQQMLVELLLVRFALFDRTLSLEDVLRGLGGGGNGGSGEGSSLSNDPKDSGGAPSAMNWRAALADVTPSSPATREPSSAISRETSHEPQRESAPESSRASTPSRESRSLETPPSFESPPPPDEPPPPESPYPDFEPPRAASRQGTTSGRSSGSTDGGSKGTGRSAPAAALSAMKRAMEASAQGEAPTRLTDEQIRTERVNVLREKDPILGAAIDTLDLELLD